MDLLGGYDSEDSSNASVVGPPSEAAAPVTTTTNSSAIPSKTAYPSPSVVLEEASSSSSKASHTAANRRGKKLLKLQAVLPSHIWHQLTTNTASSSGPQQNDDDDDDTDDEGNRDDQVTQQGPRRTFPTTPSSDRHSSLLDLLNALPKSQKKTGANAATSSTGILGSIKATTTLDATPTNASATGTTASPTPLGLGGAFLTSTVQVTRTKKGSIRSIHNPDESTTESKRNQVTMIDEPSPHKVNPLDEDPEPTTVPPHGPRFSASIPRPVPSAISATATMRTNRRPAAPPVRTKAPPPMATYPTFDDDDKHDTSSVQLRPSHQVAAVTAPVSIKARKKQMEAMLRAGNLDGIDSDIHLTSGGNANYAVEALLQQQQQQHQVAPNYQAHGVRVVPTSHYNTATGQMDASASISGKQKGKNQLNALLANAASLEASRLENPQLSANTRGTYRNNAKRKYGW